MKRLAAYNRDQERFTSKSRERLYAWVDSHEKEEKSAYLSTNSQYHKRLHMRYEVPFRYKFFDSFVEIFISFVKYSIRIYFLFKQYMNKHKIHYDFYYFFLFFYICFPIPFFFFWTIYLFFI